MASPVVSLTSTFRSSMIKKYKSSTQRKSNAYSIARLIKKLHAYIDLLFVKNISKEPIKENDANRI